MEHRRTAAGHSHEVEVKDEAADEAVEVATGVRGPPAPSLDVHAGVRGHQALYPRRWRPARLPAPQASPQNFGRTGKDVAGVSPRRLPRFVLLRSYPRSGWQAKMAFRQLQYGRSSVTR